jgi:hypothetical protein
MALTAEVLQALGRPVDVRHGQGGDLAAPEHPGEAEQDDRPVPDPDQRRGVEAVHQPAQLGDARRGRLDRGATGLGVGAGVEGLDRTVRHRVNSSGEPVLRPLRHTPKISRLLRLLGLPWLDPKSARARTMCSGSIGLISGGRNLTGLARPAPRERTTFIRRNDIKDIAAATVATSPRKDGSPVLLGYLEDSDRWTANPMRGVGL